MPKVWPSWLREDIWTLLCETGGTNHRWIRDQLAAGVYHDPVAPPESTYWDIVRALKQERGEPKDQVPPGRELDAIGAGERRFIHLMNSSLTRLEEAESKGEKVSVQDLERAGRAVKIASELAGKIEARQREKTPKSKRHQDNVRARHDNPQSLLSKLAENERPLPEESVAT